MHGIYPVLSVPQSHAFAAGTRPRSTWWDLLLPERNAGIHPPRTGLPLQHSDPEFPFLSLTRRFGIGGVGSNLDSGSEEMATHPPTTLHTSTHVMYSVHHLHFISTSVRTVPMYDPPPRAA